MTPTILIILGATGDLAGRKIYPAIYHLYRQGKLPKMFEVVGFSRRDWSDSALREHVKASLVGHHEPSHDVNLEHFLARFRYQQGEFTNSTAYVDLAKTLGRIDGEWRACANKLFYLAVPPDLYGTIFDQLAASGLTEPCSDQTGWTRIIVEKPFGRDETTAKELDEQLGKLFKEEQIYRIDHYLAKEMVQNILSLRFSNNLFEQSWNEEHIAQIDVRLLETLGVDNRGDLYDAIGTLRDVGQNHLLQMLALSLMENPGQFDAKHVRQARLNALESLALMSPTDAKTKTYRAQYDGYRSTDGVDPRSTTETYFKLVTQSASPRWRGVPLILESGKKLPQVDKSIEITFKHPMPCLCPSGTEHHTNTLTISLEPDEAISIKFWLKKPGLDFEIEERSFDFLLHDPQEQRRQIQGYEKILFDCIAGDQTLFVSTDEVRAMWRFIDRIRQAWDTGAPALKTYTPDSDKVRQTADTYLARQEETT